MDELESQIAKIQLGNAKNTSSFVYTFAEKAAGSPAEMYVVCEIPVLNPAAIESCEKICLAISAALKRAYRRPPTEETFENAIAQINEEIGKLAALGQARWIDKLNGIIGIKNRRAFTIATCGKVSAFLLRSGEFADISCSSPQSNPLKAFENYAIGKIRLNDIIILSTTQLFNYLSMERIKIILSDANFLHATQTIIELLKENAGPEVAFGTLLNMQVPLGQVADEEIDLENYILETGPKGGKLAAITAFAKSVFAFDKIKRKPSIGLPRVSSLSRRLKNLGGNTKNAVAKSKSLWTALGKGVSASRRTLDLGNFKSFSPQKKFFFISAAVLLLAFAVNLGISYNLKKHKLADQQIASGLKEAQTLLANAQTLMLYQDENGARQALSQAQRKLPDSIAVKSANKELYDQVSGQMQELRQKIEKDISIQVTAIGGLGAADFLIKLPEFVATQINGNLISYNKSSGNLEDGNLKLPDKIIGSQYINGSTAIIYDGQSLKAWNYKNGELGAVFSQNVPSQDGFAGMAAYPSNSRVYLVNKTAGQITSFLVDKNALSRPVASVKDSSLGQALDLAIDGSIYVLTPSGISKYQNGQPVKFDMPFLLIPFSGRGKIYTEKDFQNFYLLDTGNNRVVVMDKRGNLVGTIKSQSFTKLRDFQVDENNKIIYLLNDSSLLKVQY
ncbi:MAG: hypothetical protein M1383_03960 [Patescibacteria group bacterium]|nr:hypothetical protein [Patescibacteria group bacterium]